MTETFHVSLNQKGAFELVLDKKKVIKALYTDSEFYTSIGQEICIVFHVMYAKTRTESVVESFYGVIRNQEMDGGQSMQTLANRAKVDWSFPSIVSCEKAINKMAGIHINGEVSMGIKRHHVPVYNNTDSLTQKNIMSKVILRIKESEKGLAYLR